MSERIEASRVMPLPARAIFAVLCDPHGHLAIDSSGMLQEVSGEPVSATGDRFVVHMDREALGDLPMGRYDVEVTINRYVESRTIAWQVLGTVRPGIGHEYGYELEPAELDGTSATRVTSYCDWSAASEDWKPIFPVMDQKALRATLGILERTARRGYPRP